jgi:hypothetical protein
VTQLERLPGARWASRHPRLAAWLVLSVGMVGLLVFEARDVGLLITQWIALIVATVLVAGLCIWIVSWEDNNEAESEVGAGVTEAAASPTAPANAGGEAAPQRPDAAGT